MYEEIKQEGVKQPELSITEFDLKIDDEKLLQRFKQCFDGSSAFNSKLREHGRIASKYYDAKQVDRERIRDYEEEIVENRFFLSAETVIPIVTSNPAEPEIKCQIDPKLSIQVGEDKTQEMASNYASSLENMLLYDYEVTFKLRNKTRKVLRQWFKSKIGGFKLYKCAEDNEIKIDVVRPENIYLPKNGRDRWIIEYKEDTLEDIIKTFPKAKEQIKKNIADNIDEIGGTKVGYYEFTTDEYTFWKLNEIILDKRRNPNWDYEGKEEIIGYNEVIDEFGQPTAEPIVETKMYNLLDKPRHGYFFFTYFQDSEEDIVDNTSYFEQIKSLQDNINRRKRQIALISSSNGILVVSGATGIKQSDFEKLTGSPNIKIYAPQAQNASAVAYRIPPPEIPSNALTDLNDTRDALDNVFGTQASTRGERTGQETFGGRQLLKEGDLTRHQPLAEAVEDFLRDVYEYILHMRMVFTDSPYNVPLMNGSTGEEFKNLVFDRDKIPFVKYETETEAYLRPLPITLLVRSNSTIRKDAYGQFEIAMKLREGNNIDPITFYERIGEKDPQKCYDRQFLAQNNPMELLSPELRMRETERLMSMQPQDIDNTQKKNNL